jgi:Tfp pilus assembly protein PilF
MKTLSLVYLLLPLLLSCQSSKAPFPTHIESNADLFIDHEFTSSNNVHIETEDEIFKLDKDMIAMVKQKLLNDKSTRYKARVLLDHIFNSENISLQYEGNANVTASQAYHSKTANCMSLTIMAYALANEAKMNISFQKVEVPEYWVRNGQYNLLTGHVNLVVREHPYIERNIIWGERAMQIDFDPYVAKEYFPKKIIKKNTVLAMFFNNKGAEALVAKDYSTAYLYFKEAIEYDKSFSSAWGNLGVLYRFTEHYDVSVKVYRHTLSLESDNLTALKNLSLLLEDQNKDVEAVKINKYLHDIRKSNPYYYALLADEFFYKKKYYAAEEQYKKAIKLDDKRHEFYFGLAKVYYKLNKVELAKRSMRTAIKLNNVRSTNDHYIAKLNFLKRPGIHLN